MFQVCRCIFFNSPNYLKSGQVLKFCQVSEFKVEWVDADEGQDIQDVEKEPDDEHQDVVGEDHVVDDAWREVKLVVAWIFEILVVNWP